jgi:hypothetical protein
MTDLRAMQGVSYFGLRYPSRLDNSLRMVEQRPPKDTGLHNTAHAGSAIAQTVWRPNSIKNLHLYVMFDLQVPAYCCSGIETQWCRDTSNHILNQLPIVTGRDTYFWVTVSIDWPFQGVSGLTIPPTGADNGHFKGSSELQAPPGQVHTHPFQRACRF